MRDTRFAANRASTWHDKADEWNVRSPRGATYFTPSRKRKAQLPTFRTHNSLSEPETFEIYGHHRVSSRGFIHDFSCRVRSSQPSQAQPCKHIYICEARSGEIGWLEGTNWVFNGLLVPGCLNLH